MAKRTIIDDIEELEITITDIRLNALKIFLIYEKENETLTNENSIESSL